MADSDSLSRNVLSQQYILLEKDSPAIKKKVFHEYGCQKLKAFYGATLKKNNITRLASQAIIRLCISFVELLKRVKKQGNVSKFKFIALRNYLISNRIKKLEIMSYGSITINPPTVYPQSHQNYLQSTDIFYYVPDVYICALKTCKVRGGTNISIVDNFAIHHDMFDIEADITSEELHNQALINIDKRFIRITEPYNSDISIEVVAVFLDATSGNYAHWMTEILPKISVFCRVSEFYDVPLLIDEGLHPNILKSLEYVVNSDRIVYVLPKKVDILVNKAYFVSQVGYVPFGRRRGFSGKHSDGFFNPNVIGSMRDSIIEKSQAKSNLNNPSNFDKIYIRRNSSIRSLHNNDEIEALLKTYGFVAIDPELLSLNDQINIFLNATHVVSVTGAALANCIFCKPKTKVGVLMGIHNDMIYKYWLNMLSPLAIDVSYILCGMVSGNSRGIHGDFNANPEVVESMLKEWHA